MISEPELVFSKDQPAETVDGHDPRMPGQGRSPWLWALAGAAAASAVWAAAVLP